MKKAVGIYRVCQKILVVGEADFSFSLSLARGFENGSLILATSYDKLGTVIKKYKMARANIEELKKLGTSVIHEVDATLLNLDSRLCKRRFDRINFNFPQVLIEGSTSTTESKQARNILVSEYLKAASFLVEKKGEIHLTSRQVDLNLDDIPASGNYVLFIGKTLFFGCRLPRIPETAHFWSDFTAQKYEIVHEGIEKFKRAAQDLKGKVLSGQVYPVELLHNLWNVQSKHSGRTIVMHADATSTLHKNGVGATDDSSKFVWYKDHKSVIKAIYTGSDFLESVGAKDDVGFVLASTSFYAEHGGQIYDTGFLEGPKGRFEVKNVQVFGGFVLHMGSFTRQSDKFSVGDEVVCKVDYDRRKLIAPNHTCTHMLNFALREVLGDHVDQKGSIVLPEKLRFDFSHGKPVEGEHLSNIESIVNDQIKAVLNVYAKEATLAEAKRINGLRAVFGEVYPDSVRVVSVGKSIEDILADPENEEWKSYSAELCGGTHISNTREANGVRRITAVTTDFAFEAVKRADSLEQEVDDASKDDIGTLEKKVAALKNKVEQLSIPAAKKADIKKKILLLQKKVRAEKRNKAVEVATKEAEVAASMGQAFSVSYIDVGLDAASAREAVQKAVQKGIPVMVFSKDETTNKALVYAGVPPKVDKYKESDLHEWLTSALEPLKGNGGKPKGGLCCGQGKDASGLEKAIKVSKKFAELKLN